MPTCAHLPLLLSAAFALAAWLEPEWKLWSGPRHASANLLTVLMGDSRRLLAAHFFAKADAYFHKGCYPSIFDVNRPTHALHPAAHPEPEGHPHHAHADFLGEPRDWLERFSRNFHPSEHRHLGESHPPASTPGAEPRPASPGLARKGEEREILPWLRVAADLDPEHPETYVVASYWLRSRLNRVDEAEQFLREGLQHNPGNAELLFELGRIQREHRRAPDRARNLWELALQRWRTTEQTKPEPDLLLYAQLLGNLANLEEETAHFALALNYVEELNRISPNKEALQRWADDLARRCARSLPPPP
ncbi:MAG: hypothetical protein JXQ71_05655 [Verrucomicrobia bacterium]|nr:hypothetical protein [Verrucomicrobiota bacterium]